MGGISTRAGSAELEKPEPVLPQNRPLRRKIKRIRARNRPNAAGARPKGSTKAKREADARAAQEQETVQAAVTAAPESDEQSEAPTPPKEEEATDGTPLQPPGAGQGELDDTWCQFE